MSVPDSQQTWATQEKDDFLRDTGTFVRIPQRPYMTDWIAEEEWENCPKSAKDIHQIWQFIILNGLRLLGLREGLLTYGQTLLCLSRACFHNKFNDLDSNSAKYLAPERA